MNKNDLLLTRPNLEKKTPFHLGLEQLLNRESRENESNTPDYILAEYLVNCLEAYELATNIRDSRVREMSDFGR
jgi:hypothetical protein